MNKTPILKTIFLPMLAIFLFAGCSSSINIGNIPVYRSMSVSGIANTNAGPLYANSIDQDNPFGVDEENQIETKLDEFLGAGVQDEHYSYFAQSGEIVRVTINIDNPLSYVILSFNLNGRRYQSYEFREGSDSTRLLMDVQLSSDIGVQELTLDEIKYVDGSDIKDAILAGETTVKVGVLYPRLPEVMITEKHIGTTTLGLNINVNDVNGLIEGAPKPLYAFLYDGQEIVQQELAIGANTIDFNRLHSKTIYQYAIATIFDMLDGNGNVVRIFAKEALRTNAFLSMTLGITKTEITFDITADDVDSIGQVGSVELYHGETLKETVVDQTNGTFSELLANNAYLVKAHFSYQFEAEGEVFEEVEEQIATTQANAVPTLAFVDVVPGQEDIVFEYLVTDIDSVGSLAKIELIHNSVVVETMTNFDSTMFEGLLSNNDYQLKATYVYDLNDGVGEHTLEVTHNFKTLAKATPTATITNVESGHDYINFGIDFYDPDNVGKIVALELYNNDNLVKALEDTAQRSFGGLLSNTKYKIKVTYSYDLGEGKGNQVDFVDAFRPTLIDNLLTQLDEYFYYNGKIYGLVIEPVNFNQALVRAQSLGGTLAGITSSELNELLVDMIDDFGNDLWIGAERNAQDNFCWLNGEPFEFSYWSPGEPSYLSERVVHISSYNWRWNDNSKEAIMGGFLVEVIYEQNTIQTVAKNTPTMEIFDVFASKDFITFNLDIIDEDIVGRATNIELLNGSNVIATIDFNPDEWPDQLIFENLLKNTIYTIKAYFEYDLNDGAGIRSFESLFETTTTSYYGLGTITEPYQIESHDDFEAVKDFTDNYYFVITKDIDMNMTNWSPIANFRGHIDGQNHTINNLNITQSYTETVSNHALFNNFEGSISNLTFNNININASSDYSINVGVIAAQGNITATNVHFSGNANISSYSMVYFGALMGNGNVINASEVTTALNVNITTSNNIYFGLLQGRGNTGNYSLFNLKGNAFLSNDGGTIYGGGIVGHSDIDCNIEQGIIDLSLESHSAHNEQFLGGAIGIVHGNLNFSNVITLGNIGNYDSPSYTYSGGLIGYIEGDSQSYKYIEKSISFIDIITTGYNWAGNLFGNVTGGTAFSNLYRSEGQTIVNDIYEKIRSIDGTNSKISPILYPEFTTNEFYLTKIGLDSSYFNIDALIAKVISFDPLGDKYPSVMYVAVGDAFGDQFGKWDPNSRDYLLDYDLESKEYTLNNVYIVEGDFALVIFRTWDGRIGFNNLTNVPAGFELSPNYGDIRVTELGIGTYNFHLVFIESEAQLTLTRVI